MIDLETDYKTNRKEGRPRLLLADDSATIRKVVELTFADEGIDVTAVADAGSAMEEFVRTQPDIVLVDINLPGTPGYQICEMIKQDEATTSIPVLLLVGSFEPFDHEEAERVRADGFLLKPFKSIRELVTQVKELLSQPAVDSRPAPLSPDNISERDAMGWPQIESSAEDSEANDIEDLYQQSFVDTAEIQEFETVDDLLSDSGMDDELIESKQPFGLGSDSSDAVPPESRHSPFPAESEGSFSRIDQSGSHEQPRDVFPTDPAIGLAPAPVSESPAEEQPEADGQKIRSAYQFEPSEEFIDLVVNRVVERVSGREIRDVAREVVQRIAEKLIREALAEEKKS